MQEYGTLLLYFLAQNGCLARGPSTKIYWYVSLDVSIDLFSQECFSASLAIEEDKSCC